MLTIIAAVAIAVLIFGCVLVMCVHQRKKYTVTPRDSTKVLKRHKPIIPTIPTNHADYEMPPSHLKVNNTGVPTGATVIITDKSNPYNDQNSLSVAAWMMEMDRRYSSNNTEVVVDDDSRQSSGVDEEIENK